MENLDSIPKIYNWKYSHFSSLLDANDNFWGSSENPHKRINDSIFFQKLFSKNNSTLIS